jgi:hypothetical protein
MIALPAAASVRPARKEVRIDPLQKELQSDITRRGERR